MSISTSPAPPYAQRLVDLQITSPVGSGIVFGPSKSNSITLSGYRVSATIANVGIVSRAMASIQILGMTQSDMNTLTSRQQYIYYSQNNVTVTILAGDAIGGMKIAFEGVMTSALDDPSDLPNVSFNILAVQQYNSAIDQPPALSFQGTLSIGTICALLATRMGLTLENNGCTSVLTNQYLHGSTLDQLNRATQAAKVLYIIENGVLAIWPNGSYRTTQTTVPTISAANGMVGYPQSTAVGVNFRTLYNPNLKYGSLINMQSSKQPACGQWVIANLTHTLESNLPHGGWFTDAQCCKPGMLSFVTAGN